MKCARLAMSLWKSQQSCRRSRLRWWQRGARVACFHQWWRSNNECANEPRVGSIEPRACSVSKSDGARRVLLWWQSSTHFDLSLARPTRRAPLPTTNMRARAVDSAVCLHRMLFRICAAVFSSASLSTLALCRLSSSDAASLIVPAARPASGKLVELGRPYSPIAAGCRGTTWKW
jgi:hypothetical protein